MGLFSRKIVYGIKGVAVETKKLGKPTKEVALHTKKVIEYTGPTRKGKPINPKIREIHDTSKNRNPLSKSVYVRPSGFIDFEAGRSKISTQKYTRPKSFYTFGDMF